MQIRAKYTSKGEEAASGPIRRLKNMPVASRTVHCGQSQLGQALKRLVHVGLLICISASLIELHQPQPANHTANHQCSSRVPHARLCAAPAARGTVCRSPTTAGGHPGCRSFPAASQPASQPINQQAQAAWPRACDLATMRLRQQRHLAKDATNPNLPTVIYYTKESISLLSPKPEEYRTSIQGRVSSEEDRSELMMIHSSSTQSTHAARVRLYFEFLAAHKVRNN